MDQFSKRLILVSITIVCLTLTISGIYYAVVIIPQQQVQQAKIDAETRRLQQDAEAKKLKEAAAKKAEEEAKNLVQKQYDDCMRNGYRLFLEHNPNATPIEAKVQLEAVCSLEYPR